MGLPWTDVAIILGLIALNGFFAGAELAIVSARKPRLAVMQRANVRGAATALRLQAEQGRFLSAVQIGITLVGVANGAFSGASLAKPTADILAAAGVPADWANELGFALVIVVVTYLSLIIGELVPKQLALRAPERIAVVVAPIMEMVTRITSPFVSFLDASTSLIFRLLRINREADNGVTEEELRHVVQEAEQAGVIEGEERELISGIMRLADRQVRGVMTPRREVDWLDASAPDEAVRARLISTPHTRLVVAEGTIDHILGVVQARDALAALLEGRPLQLKALVRQAPVVPDVADATVVLSVLRDADVPMAVVIDEYGHFEGVVTPADLLAAIAGEFRSDMDDVHDPAIVERVDGSWLISGSLPADELAEKLGFVLDEERDYQTVAGFALAELEHIPATGESFEIHGFRFEVIDMDGRKIDKLLVSRLEAQ
ncbi:hemolysin family protein [Sandaracinobacter sp. RS1-74]|uniref:hemolysin family protein n=1 Tax=Sandaracinobacteroides sayramensis TaxID=2913411 RepID=UPI001EDA67CE|nr:hemolysin family protein [Sandaracinobacteroides sayramensis]MCG2839362.1 hemolysin family protein [Sandaracinobacteroides sayramensis]